MNDPALTLMQWLSPAFPVGAFAYSHGLEQAIADGQVSDADTLCDWIEALIVQGSARADAILLASAYKTDDLIDVDATARAFAAGLSGSRKATCKGPRFATQRAPSGGSTSGG